MSKYCFSAEVATGRPDIQYDNLGALGVQVYGMPPGVPFHNPLLYNQQQLQQILANLEKIVFLKLSHVSSQLHFCMYMYMCDFVAIHSKSELHVHVRTYYRVSHKLQSVSKTLYHVCNASRGCILNFSMQHGHIHIHTCLGHVQSCT